MKSQTATRIHCRVMQVSIIPISNWVKYITHNNIKVLNYQLISNNWCKCKRF